MLFQSDGLLNFSYNYSVTINQPVCRYWIHTNIAAGRVPNLQRSLTCSSLKSIKLNAFIQHLYRDLKITKTVKPFSFLNFRLCTFYSSNHIRVFHSAWTKIFKLGQKSINTTFFFPLKDDNAKVFSIRVWKGKFNCLIANVSTVFILRWKVYGMLDKWSSTTMSKQETEFLSIRICFDYLGACKFRKNENI